MARRRFQRRNEINRSPFIRSRSGASRVAVRAQKRCLLGVTNPLMCLRPFGCACVYDRAFVLVAATKSPC